MILDLSRWTSELALESETGCQEQRRSRGRSRGLLSTNTKLHIWTVHIHSIHTHIHTYVVLRSITYLGLCRYWSVLSTQTLVARVYYICIYIPVELPEPEPEPRPHICTRVPAPSLGLWVGCSSDDGRELPPPSPQPPVYTYILHACYFSIFIGNDVVEYSFFIHSVTVAFSVCGTRRDGLGEKQEVARR